MHSKDLFADLRAGIVVFLVALPLCLGIAMACGFPPISGIIAGITGGLVVTLFSNATFSVSGPAAGLTAIVITSVHQLGSLNAFMAAALVAGVLQIAFGIVKAGGIGNFIPNPVIRGMLAGIGIILIIKQLPHLVGYDADPEGDLYFDQPDGHNSFSDLYYMFNYVTPGSVLIALASLAAMLLADRTFYKKNNMLAYIPGPLLAVTVGIVLNVLFSASAKLQVKPEHLVSLPIVSSVQHLRGYLPFPDFAAVATVPFWTVVITLSLVASLETLLNIEAIEKLDPGKHEADPNRELMAQGIGNIASSLAGGLPVTSVIVRSSANIHAGARSRLSVAFHALLLLLSVLFFPRLLSLIPNSSLAVILVMTGYKLARVSIFKELFKNGWDQFLPFVVTIAVMLLTDLLKGVAAGVLVAVFFIIRASIRSSFEIVEEVINQQTSYLIKLPQHITFFNKGFLVRYLKKVKTGSLVIIDGTITRSTDKDVREVMIDFVKSASKKNIHIQFIKYQL